MRLYFIILISCLSLPCRPCSAAGDETLAVIVAPEYVTKSMSKSELALIFWRKKLYWGNGQRIRPVNLPAENVTRHQFSKRILGSLPESQSGYWNGLYYHGVSPPYVVHSSEAALRFVAETNGAIAYIPACSVDDRVKVLAWIDEEGDVLSLAPNLNCSE